MVILKFLNSSLSSSNRFVNCFEIRVPAKPLNNLNKEKVVGWLFLIMIPFYCPYRSFYSLVFREELIIGNTWRKRCLAASGGPLASRLDTSLRGVIKF